MILQTISAFRTRFPHIAIGQGYGMTESSTIISTMDASHDFPGASAGYLLPNVECVFLFSRRPRLVNKGT